MLHIHRAERADGLADALAAVLASPLDDPFATEVVAVPSRGIERWLGQRLATTLGSSDHRDDGVCANVDFPFPGSVVGAALAAATGVDHATDPWHPERAVWSLLEVVEAERDTTWLRPLTVHLDGDGGDRGAGGRRLGVVRRIAARYDRYAVHRPTLLQAWAAGTDTTGEGARLPADVVWQAQLWRALRERLGTPSPAERLDVACDRLRDSPDLVDLPSRLAVFGLTRLPASQLAVLQALAEPRDVHLLLLHPSPALWAGIAAAGGPRGAIPRGEDLTDGMAVNALLAGWGRDARELQLIVGTATAQDHHHPIDRTPSTLLERLQDDVRGDRTPHGVPHPGAVDRRPLLAADDRSVQVHACHGRTRQVEVVRDAILHLLADDPTLEPRDIIVLCPDIEAYAPLIHAAFGGPTARPDPPGADTGDTGDSVDTGRPDLRVRIADRALRQTNPLLGGVAALLELASARCTASQVLELLNRAPVGRRFGLHEDDLARIDGWVRASGIRWGIDAAGRVPWKVALEDGTWRRGLDRILLGAALSEDSLPLVSGLLPLDDVGSGDIDLAGRLAELIDRLEDALAALGVAQPLAQWVTALLGAADALLATAGDETWQRAELDRLLADLLEKAGGPTPALTPAEVRDLLGVRLGGRPTSAGFRTGHLTVCTLVPMRSIPHRVVCVLGLDDGAFPRSAAPDGDDILHRAPHVGDHDARSEDRQLLLDALLAAGEHLVIAYAGRDERTNATLPPAVPVGELLDAVDATVHTEVEGRRAREQVIVRQPLQVYDPRNFEAGALVGTTPWGFSSTALAGARALTGPRDDQPGFLAAPLPPPPPEDEVPLAALVAFVAHPVRSFLRERLGLVTDRSADEPQNAMTIELSRLEGWAIGERVLTARRAGVPPQVCRAAELARGALPVGGLGARPLDDICVTVERLLQRLGAGTIASSGAGAAEPVRGRIDVDVLLDDGRRLLGTVGGIVDDRLEQVAYRRLDGPDRLGSWVRLLAAVLADPTRDLTAVTVGRGAEDGSVASATIRSLGPDAATREEVARQHLMTLLDLRDRGRFEPLPLYARASAAYARTVAAGCDPENIARAVAEAWESAWERPGEHADAEHILVGAGPTLADITLPSPPGLDERGSGWSTAPSRFGRLSQRLWSGLLTHEQVAWR